VLVRRRPQARGTRATGHAVEEADPEFVINVILDVIKAAKNQ
jgi:hypothetical protein